jgi:hypothetical protein
MRGFFSPSTPLRELSLSNGRFDTWNENLNQILALVFVLYSKFDVGVFTTWTSDVRRSSLNAHLLRAGRFAAPLLHDILGIFLLYGITDRSESVSDMTSLKIMPLADSDFPPLRSDMRINPKSFRLAFETTAKMPYILPVPVQRFKV